MSVRRRTIRKVFVDTNVILDFFLEREGFYRDALKLWVSCGVPSKAWLNL